MNTGCVDVTVCQLQGLCSAWTWRVFADGHITFTPVVTMLKLWVCTGTTYHFRRQINFESCRVVPDFVLHIRETDRPLYTRVWEVLHKTWRVTRFFSGTPAYKNNSKKNPFIYLNGKWLCTRVVGTDVEQKSSHSTWNLCAESSVWRKITWHWQSKDRSFEVTIQIQHVRNCLKANFQSTLHIFNKAYVCRLWWPWQTFNSFVCFPATAVVWLVASHIFILTH